MLTDFPDLRTPDAIAVRASIGVVERISAADLGRPTPCAGWRLGDLVAHMTVQHHKFAAAAAGQITNPQSWWADPSTDDPVQAYVSAADKALAAFAHHHVLDRDFPLNEGGTIHTVPGRMAIGFHLVDYVAHGWDVARSLGVAWDLPEGVLQAAWPVARSVPDDATRLAPGAPFAPKVPETEQQDDLLGRILRALGRSPDWSPATS